MFAWRDAVARDARTGAALNGIATVGAWRALGGARPQRPDRAERRRRACPRERCASCAGARSWRASRWPSPRSTAPGSGRCAPRSPRRSCAARACARWARSPRASASATRYVVFGHTHRAGPLPGDDEQEWRGRGGRPPRQRRQLDVRVDLPRAHARREPLLAGRVRARRRGRSAAGAAAAAGPHPRGAARLAAGRREPDAADRRGAQCALSARPLQPVSARRA